MSNAQAQLPGLSERALRRASGFAGAAVAWQLQALPVHRRLRRLWLATLPPLVGAAGVYAWHVERTAAPVAASAAAAVPKDTSPFDGAGHSFAAPASAAAAASYSETPRLAAHVQRRGADIDIDVVGMPLAEVAQRLAAATNTLIHGYPELAAGRQVTLHWQGRSAQAAWHQLLANEVNYAAQCAADGCRLWVTGLIPNTASVLPAAGAASAATATRTATRAASHAAAGAASPTLHAADEVPAAHAPGDLAAAEADLQLLRSRSGDSGD